MRKFLGATALLTLALGLLAPTARAEDKKVGGVRGEILMQLDDAREKLLALAEAMPADKYGWRPQEGVRSVGEVFAHVAGGNYYLASFWEAKTPEGVDPRGFEKEGGDKAKTIASLTTSFSYLRHEIEAVPDSDLDRAVKMFGADRNVLAVMLTLASHAHEHLGQSIAYARMNGVTPPWSK